MKVQFVQPMLGVCTPLPALTKWTIASLLGTTAAFVYLQVVITGQSGPGIMVCALSFLFAVIVAIGWRWTPILGFVGGMWLIVGTLEHIVIELAQPNETHLFAWVVARLTITVLGAIAGVAATVQNYRHTATSHTPRWFAFTGASITALSLGAILVAAIPQTTNVISV